MFEQFRVVHIFILSGVMFLVKIATFLLIAFMLELASNTVEILSSVYVVLKNLFDEIAPSIFTRPIHHLFVRLVIFSPILIHPTQLFHINHENVLSETLYVALLKSNQPAFSDHAYHESDHIFILLVFPVYMSSVLCIFAHQIASIQNDPVRYCFSVLISMCSPLPHRGSSEYRINHQFQPLEFHCQLICDTPPVPEIFRISLKVVAYNNASIHRYKITRIITRGVFR